MGPLSVCLFLCGALDSCGCFTLLIQTLSDVRDDKELGELNVKPLLAGSHNNFQMLDSKIKY